MRRRGTPAYTPIPDDFRTIFIFRTVIIFEKITQCLIIEHILISILSTDMPIQVVDDDAMYVPDTSLISRADTTRFMLSCLGTTRWDGKCPAVATH